MNFTSLIQSLTALDLNNAIAAREKLFQLLPVGYTDPVILRSVAAWHAESAKRFVVMRVDSERSRYHDATAQRLFNLAEDLERLALTE